MKTTSSASALRKCWHQAARAGAGSLLAYNFQLKSGASGKKIKALRHTYERRRNNQQQILKLREILTRYLEYLQGKEIKTSVESRSDDVCQQIRTTIGDCLDQPGCAVIRRDPNHKDGDKTIYSADDKKRKEPLRKASDPLASVLGATQCRAKNTGLIEEEKEPARNALDAPVPAFLARGAPFASAGRNPIEGAVGRMVERPLQEKS